MRYVKDAASVIRSKNAGPYELTFDLMYHDAETYEQDRNSITKEKNAAQYKIDESNEHSIIHFAPANAEKITNLRPRASGDLGETDVYGAQQHAPLLELT